MRFPGATHLVVLAQREEPGIASFLESTLMEWLDLAINREKTRTVHLKAEKASLDFLGFPFRWDRDKFYATGAATSMCFRPKRRSSESGNSFMR